MSKTGVGFFSDIAKTAREILYKDYNYDRKFSITTQSVVGLLPSIEAVIKTPSTGRDNKRPPILVLVICPTRELASQAVAEAKNCLNIILLLASK